MKNSRSLFTILFFTILFACSANADTWRLPEKRTVCSKNDKFCLKIIPKKLTSQLDYFQDKVDGKENTGADSKIKKNLCRGIFSIRDDNGILRKRWEINLVNEVSPVSVLISDRGDYVITFDNWHGVGYGDDVVTIYRSFDGKLIRKFGLSDFLTESDINELPASTSSIHWGGGHWIDKTKNQLVLKISKGKRFFEKEFEFFEIRVELSTGKILDEKRDRLPSLQFLIRPISEEANPPTVTVATNEDACFEGKESEIISSASLLSRAIEKPSPIYPPAARAVRATGKVIIEVLVSTEGTVECARAISGHPLLKASTTAAIKKWIFHRATTSYSGFVVFEGTYALIGPDGTVFERIP